MNVKKLVGSKAFYKMVLGITIPIIIQNGITNFVNLLDNIMVGRLGTEQLSGVGMGRPNYQVCKTCRLLSLPAAREFFR